MCGRCPKKGWRATDIRWGLDRRALDRPSRGALTASDLFRVGAMLYPAAMTAATRGSDRLVLAEEITLRAQAEATLLATGITLLLKDATSRPRPFTYSARGDLPHAIPSTTPPARMRSHRFPPVTRRRPGRRR